MVPIGRPALANDQGAGEGGKAHSDGRQADPDSGARRRRRGGILDPAQIRAIKPGYGLLLMASARPIMLTLRPWVDRSDASTVREQRAGVEEDIRRHAATWHA